LVAGLVGVQERRIDALAERRAAGLDARLIAQFGLFSGARQAMQNAAHELRAAERRFTGRQADRAYQLGRGIDRSAKYAGRHVEGALPKCRWRSRRDVRAARNTSAIAAVFRRLRG
jgi:hypothetical protein